MKRRVSLLAELPGERQHAACCVPCQLVHDGVGGEQQEAGGKEKSTWVAKVGSEGDGASPLTGVQVEGGFAPTGPGMEKLRNSCLYSQPVGHLGSRHATLKQGGEGFIPRLLRSVIKLGKLGRLS